MTYILSWISKGNVYIVADSMVTFSNEVLKDNDIEISSFGESSYLGKEFSVKERGLKISNISDKVIGSFSGDNSQGADILNNLKRRLDYKKENKISDAIKESLSESILEENTIHFGFFEDSCPHLITTNSESYKDSISDKEFHCSGILDNNLTSYSAHVLRANEYFEDEPEIYLAVVVASLQSYLIKYPMIDRGVGGFFSGAFINESGVHWLPDTNYLVYESNIKHWNLYLIITRFFLGNLLLFSTLKSKTSKIHVFFGEMSVDELEVKNNGIKLKKLYSEILKKIGDTKTFLKSKPRFIFLLDIPNFYITCIDWNNEKLRQLIKFEIVENELKVYLKEELMKMLLEYNNDAMQDFKKDDTDNENDIYVKYEFLL